MTMPTHATMENSVAHNKNLLALSKEIIMWHIPADLIIEHITKNLALFLKAMIAIPRVASI
jgi:hypothetical protein